MKYLLLLFLAACAEETEPKPPPDADRCPPGASIICELPDPCESGLKPLQYCKFYDFVGYYDWDRCACPEHRE